MGTLFGSRSCWRFFSSAVSISNRRISGRLPFLYRYRLSFQYRHTSYKVETALANREKHGQPATSKQREDKQEGEREGGKEGGGKGERKRRKEGGGGREGGRRGGWRGEASASKAVLGILAPSRLAASLRVVLSTKRPICTRAFSSVCNFFSASSFCFN